MTDTGSPKIGESVEHKGRQAVVVELDLGGRHRQETFGDEWDQITRTAGASYYIEYLPDLAEQGMSSRAIAPVVGASRETVRKDIASDNNVSDAPRTVKSIDGIERTFQPRPAATPTTADHDTGENADDRKPKAEAITAQFNSAVVDLNRLMDRLHRITEQDAYTRNADKIATLYKADIDRAISDLTHIANTL